MRLGHGRNKRALAKAKLGERERLDAIRRLDEQTRRHERTATGPTLSAFIAEERHRSHEYGGRSIFGWDSARTEDEPATGRTVSGSIRS